MSNNRSMQPLTALAFNAFLRARQELHFETSPAYDAVFEQQIIKLAPDFLTFITERKLKEAEQLLNLCPELAVMASGTIVTVSGNTYPVKSGIELMYLMDDIDMCKMMLPYIQKLPADMIKKAHAQLTKKMIEVKKQRGAFKPYDFSIVVKAITTDELLKQTGFLNPETKNALEKFKDDFKPSIIKEGRFLIEEHLQDAFYAYEQNVLLNYEKSNTWNDKQIKWYLIHVVGHLQTLAEKRFELACSKGLGKIVDEKEPLPLSNDTENYLLELDEENDYISHLPMTYRRSVDGSLLLARDFFIDPSHGGARIGIDGPDGITFSDTVLRHLEYYILQQNQAWAMISLSLSSTHTDKHHITPCP